MNKFGKINWALTAVLLAIILGLLILLLVMMDGGKPADLQQNPGTTESASSAQGVLDILSITDDHQMVTVTTNFCSVKYPYAFSDLVRVETVNEDAKTALLFTAYINGVKTNIYELVFGGQSGTKVGDLAVDGETVGVFVVFYPAVPGQDESSRLAFIAAQETINDVTASLRENGNFTPV